MTLIDSHCHLNDLPIDDILSRAADANVAYLINIGAGDGVEGNARAVELARRYPQIFSTVGMHPHDAKLVDDSVIQRLDSLARHEKVVAIGEIGLDFHYEHSPRDKQEEVFHQFIDLAQKLGKPIVIHDRDAAQRTHDILKEHGVKPNQAVIHCFTGTLDLAKKYLNLGYCLSFTGIVTFKKSLELHEVVRYVPIEKMLIETDAPWLAPEPYRGKPNEPSYVRFVALKIAELKKLSIDDVARMTTLNAKRFFNLPLPDFSAQIVYTIRDAIYLNITNKCTLACRFCPKFIDYEVKGYYLKLLKEPTAKEVLANIFLGRGDRPVALPFKEIVFCGYGEPTKRLDVLLEIAQKIKKDFPHIKIRVNTDGLGNLIHQRNILPDLATCIDALSVSLNAQNAATYVKYCPSKYKEAAYEAVKSFIRQATQFIPDVTATVVGAPDVDQNACRQIATELGAQFRFREYNNVG